MTSWFLKESIIVTFDWLDLIVYQKLVSESYPAIHTKLNKEFEDHNIGGVWISHPIHVFPFNLSLFWFEVIQRTINTLPNRIFKNTQTFVKNIPLRAGFKSLFAKYRFQFQPCKLVELILSGLIKMSPDNREERCIKKSNKI